jgi:hypothetical protein
MFNYDISSDTLKINVLTKFNQNDVSFILKYPIEVNIDDEKISVSEFQNKIKLNMVNIYELSKAIFEKTMEDPEWIDIEFLSKQEYEIKLIRINSDTLVYEIKDTNGIDQEPFIYRFAMKYNI